MKNVPSVAYLQAIFDVIPSPVFVKDRSHQFVLLNNAACALFGHPREILLAALDSDLFPAGQVKAFREADNRVFDGAEDESEEEVTDAWGAVRSVITRKRAIRFRGRQFLVGVVTDVTARREAEAQTRFLAFHDALTGLPNRSLLKERIDQLLLLPTGGEARGLALMYIDLDRFKEVNDDYGHPSGDALLRTFAARLTGIVRPCDTVARLGGDEFAILLAGTNDTFRPADVCQRAVEAASEPFLVDGQQLFVSASIGIAFATGHIGQIELQRQADVALYHAKREGRSCWRAYDADLEDGTKVRRMLEVDMRQALASGSGFEVFYQPVVAASDYRIVGVEALVRWRHPRLGLLQPDAFIAVAEETGLIVPLGEWVLSEACSWIARWPHLSVAVNISPTQLRRAGLVDRVLTIVGRSGLHPGRLELEVTETTMLDADSASSIALKALRAAGIGIVLDDFGTGYSSLTHLQKLKVDRVKIDRSFVQQIGELEESEAIVHALAALCRKLGIAVTAEGVETEAQRRFLRSTACTDFQGFLFSRPLSQTAATAFLDAALGSPSVAA
ncbi:MAG TPA: EAL domain-containing protein [Allosphingosinicella sp.]|nr:EAL domain-containing protein [Allosphingosinicella sp.]